MCVTFTICVIILSSAIPYHIVVWRNYQIMSVDYGEMIDRQIVIPDK